MDMDMDMDMDDGWMMVVWVYRMGIRLIDTQLKYSHSIDKHKHEEEEDDEEEDDEEEDLFPSSQVPALLSGPLQHT